MSKGDMNDMKRQIIEMVQNMDDIRSILLIREILKRIA